MSEAAGASARAIRQAVGATLADVAKAAKDAGLPWSSGRVGDFESGRIAPSLPTLIAVAGALSAVVDRELVGLSDLFAVDGYVQINDKITLDAKRLRGLLAGDGFQITLGDLGTEGDELSAKIDRLWDATEAMLQAIPSDIRPQTPEIVSTHRAFVEGDERIARSLGLSKFLAAALMAVAWQQTFVQRRDEIAGEAANAQRKGIVARQLKQELKDLQRQLDW